MKRNVILISASLLVGCSTFNAEYQVPVPQNYVKEYQYKIQASRHWQIIANDIAQQSINSLKKKNLEKSDLVIEENDYESDFTTALNNFIISNLVNNDIRVIQNPTGSTLKLKHDIQVIEFNSNRKNRKHSDYTPGMYTAGATGLSILSNAVYKWSRSSEIAGSIGFGGVLDLIHIARDKDESNLKIPNVEIIVNTSIVDENKFLARKSDVYYINEDDLSLFKGIKKYQPKTLNVVNH